MFSKSSRKSRSVPLAVVLVISLVLPMIFGPAARPGQAAPFDKQPSEGEPVTALQTELANAIRQRQAAGLPAPTVTFSAQTTGNRSLDSQVGSQTQGNEGKPYTVIAKTIIYFKGPQEAGYDEWPAIEITGDLVGSTSAPFSTGDLSDVIRKRIADQNPTFWKQVEFGHEARRFTFTETLEQSAPSQELSKVLNPGSFINTISSADILMGFTYSGPDIDNTVEEQLELCIPIFWWGELCYEAFYIKAGVEFNWAFGLRLPASIDLQAPDAVEQGSEANFQTSLNPQDWNAGKYSEYGVTPWGGNEFLLQFTFFAGVHLRIAGQETCPPGYVCYVEFMLDQSTSFTTPFGEGSSFPIPPLVIPIFSVGIENFLTFSSSLHITPEITSTRIEADWHTVEGSDCSGSGTVTYTTPGELVDLGPVPICNLDEDPTTNQAQVEIENFRYYFNTFKLTLGAYAAVDLFGFFSDEFGFDFYTLDLSDFFEGLGLAVGDHVECNWDFTECGRKGPPNLLSLTATTTDTTPPITSITLPVIDGDNGWYVSDVQFSLSATDTCASGIAKTEYSLDDNSWSIYTDPVLLSDEGIITVYYRSTDKDGNVELTKTKTIMIDKTPPIITGAPSAPANSFGWWNEDVTVHFEATDATSGIDIVTPDLTIGSEGANQSVIGTASDMAGNEAQVTVSDINIDKTPPVLSITSPLPQAYDNIDYFNIEWTTSDSLSGINTEEGDMDGIPMPNGQLVDLRLVAAGSHTVTVEAMDKANNGSTESVDFTVQVDIDGLIASVEHMCEIGWVKTPGICKSLLAELKSADRAIDRGQCSVGENILNAFIYEVEALRGIGVTDDAANVLEADAQYVINNLVCVIGSP